MKKIIIAALITLTLIQVNAQKQYYTKTGKISFVNKTDVQTIEANNNAVTAIIDSKAGTVAFSLLIKSFTFSKALMQQHFNDNYMESTKLPKSDFKGTITNNTDIKYTTDGTYTAKVKGKLTLHGVTKDVTTNATITVKAGKISAASSFTITLADYSIKTDQIGKTATISINTGNLTAK
jgi:flagellar basal body P-ring protein FlgI